MALAVLRGDRAAAMALADKLAEEQVGLPDVNYDSKTHKGTVDGYEVYHWPEFRALCHRLGIAYGLGTRTLTIRLAEGEAVTVTQEYLTRARTDDQGEQQ